MAILYKGTNEDIYIQEIMHHLRLIELSLVAYSHNTKIVSLEVFKEIVANLENTKKLLTIHDLYSTGSLEEILKYDSSAI